MRLTKLIAIGVVIPILSFTVTVGLLFAQESNTKPILSADGSLADVPTEYGLPGNDILPTLTQHDTSTEVLTGTTEAVVVIEYDLPISPTNLLVSLEGEIWFSSFWGNAIGHLDTANQLLSVYSRKHDGGNVWGIAKDPAGDIWYGTVNVNTNEVVGKFLPATNTFVEWPIPGTGNSHFGLDLDPNTADVWFASRGDVLGDIPGVYRLSPTTNNVTSWSTFPFTDTYDLDLGPDGNIWLTIQPAGNQGVVKLDPSTDRVVAWEMPISNSRPFRIVAVSSDEIWFTEAATVTNSIARLTPSENVLDEFRVSIPNSFPHSLRKHGTKVRFTARGANSIGELDISSASPTTTTILSPVTFSTIKQLMIILPIRHEATTSTTTSLVNTFLVTPTMSDAFTMTPLPMDNSRAFGLALDLSENDVWFAESSGRIGKINLGPLETVFFPIASHGPPSPGKQETQ